MMRINIYVATLIALWIIGMCIFAGMNFITSPFQVSLATLRPSILVGLILALLFIFFVVLWNSREDVRKS
jgi:hypothetical protein